MIYDACTLIGPTGTLALGNVTHTTAGSSGYTVELNTTPGPLVVYRSELKQTTGGIVVPGKRGPREVTIRGQVLGINRHDLAGRWAALMAFLGDLDGELLGVSVEVPPADPLFALPTTRTLYGAIDGGLEVERLTPLAESFELRLICPDPVAYGITEIETLTGTPGVTVTNAGDGQVGAVFVIAGPSSGTATAVRIGSTTTGKKVDVSGISLASGDELVLDTTPGRETLTVNDVSVAGTIDVASRWPLLLPGTNQVYVTRTGGSGDLTGTVEWRSGWVS
jgi:hypothetical protein